MRPLQRRDRLDRSLEQVLELLAGAVDHLAGIAWLRSGDRLFCRCFLLPLLLLLLGLLLLLRLPALGQRLLALGLRLVALGLRVLVLGSVRLLVLVRVRGQRSRRSRCRPCRADRGGDLGGLLDGVMRLLASPVCGGLGLTWRV